MPEDIVLNVTRLRVLRELAHRGSIAAVADALWLTPSAVSQQLSALERETRVQLVERAGRGVKLTAAGQVLADHSERVFEALDEARAALHALQTQPTGRLRVASFPSVVRLVIPRVLARLRERFPDLLVEVEDLEGEQSLEAVRLGHVDVAVIDDLTWSAGRHEGLRTTELFATPLVVVFATGAPPRRPRRPSHGPISPLSPRSPSIDPPSSRTASKPNAAAQASSLASTPESTTRAPCSPSSKAAT